ncbi:hypothetical protein [Paenibacillus mendelii]|uniref:SbsA Ig-like domain-containing protein n=1 Tax=Paenibacillus mendelii TaxID=206163 RepID=A0ABV6J543_9BACL|nr:hypothetical protein [Paenibacillus mendelii]MCQ6561869.1 hypothetical protein [Paenibacillus mendelii]
MSIAGATGDPCEGETSQASPKPISGSIDGNQIYIEFSNMMVEGEYEYQEINPENIQITDLSNSSIRVESAYLESSTLVISVLLDEELPPEGSELDPPVDEPSGSVWDEVTGIEVAIAEGTFHSYSCEVPVEQIDQYRILTERGKEDLRNLLHPSEEGDVSLSDVIRFLWSADRPSNIIGTPGINAADARYLMSLTAGW